MLEDQAMKFAVIRGETCPVDWKKLGDPNNWVKLGTHVDGLRVERTSQNIIIHPGKMSGFKIETLLFDSGRAVQKCKDILEGQFGMLLSIEGVKLHEPVFRFYSEEAKEDVKHCTVIVDGVGTVDNSPPEHIPHEEYTGIERAKARILLPDTVKSLRNEVYAFKTDSKANIDSLKKEIGELKSQNIELISTNIELVKEVKVLSSQVRVLIGALHEGSQPKQQEQSVTTASILERIYE